MNQDLLRRVQRLEAIEAIHGHKARYSAIADAKYTATYERQKPQRMRELAEQQAACFTEQAVWFGGEFGGDRTGRVALAQWFEQSPWRWAAHYYQSPQIQLENCLTRASATWLLWQLALRAENGEAIFLTATTFEQYRLCEQQGWLIDSMRFTDLHVMPANLGSMPIHPHLQSLDAARRLRGPE
jgi:hypothetical protein